MEEWGHLEQPSTSPRTWMETRVKEKPETPRGTPEHLEEMGHPEGSTGEPSKDEAPRTTPKNL